MITKALAQNLVAIGMADLIQRAYQVSLNCCYEPHMGCCQEQNSDVFEQALIYLGMDEKEDE